MAGLSDAQLFDWLRLIRSENVGPATFRQLINTYGSAARALEALPHLSRRSGKPIRVHSSEATEREMDEAARRGLRLVVTTDPDYPYALRAFDPPPPILTLAGGSPALSQRPAVAMVGSRNASAAGMRLCADMSEVCGRAGLVVVSGLARGIDAASHRASLASGTIAVLAGGHANIYPPEHESLAAEIVERGGAVVTEMPLGWQARAQDFLRRNRI
ncbi:MAG: DNA-protecting protein DprA, partial [Hyphomicrobiaceae bacterium]|nr:DNA-protecting protein DprA [Hyphomicrobiaceae bacterium]